MIDGRRVLGVIPARGGSKGLPRKNLRQVEGRPLIAWSIEECRRASLLDRLVVNTDDPEIAEVARAWGAEVPLMRPAEFATDTARPEDAIVHLLRHLPETYDYVLMLHSTVPLRRAEDIDGAVRRCHDAGAPACVSVTDPGKPPQWLLSADENGRMVPVFGWDGFVRRRQDVAPTVIPYGAVFVARVPYFLEKANFYGPESVMFPMPRERSVDIDDELDLCYFETLLRRGRAGSAP